MSQTPRPTSHETRVLDTTLLHVELGAGRPIVFLHGNPTSSRLWRDVLPHVAGDGRCLAPDLVGMGRSGKPSIAYSFADHARYLDAWLDATLGNEPAVFVGHDWGGALAMHFAARHPDRVRGLVLLETFLRPLHWSDWPEEGRKMFQAIRTPGVGEKMVLDENGFLARSLAHGVLRPLGDDERAAYAAPFPTPASRVPMLQWPRQIPIDGAPADVHAAFEAFDAWLARSTDVPKLLLTFDAPSVLVSPDAIAWARANVAALEVVGLPRAGHHAPEDVPHPIGQAIHDFVRRRVTASP